MGLEKTRIQNTLISTGKEGPFFAEDYDPDSGLLTVNEGKVISPASVLSDEVSCEWEPSRNRRQGYLFDRQRWRFRLMLGFHQRVSTELFEKAVTESPLCIPLDKENGLRAVVLILINARYVHPPKHQSASGSQVDLFFEAKLSPS